VRLSLGIWAAVYDRCNVVKLPYYERAEGTPIHVLVDDCIIGLSPEQKGFMGRISPLCKGDDDDDSCSDSSYQDFYHDC